MKLKMKTTAILLIAIFMISAFAVAVSAGQYIVLDSADAVWPGAVATTDEYLLGTGSWEVYPDHYPGPYSDANKMELYLPINVLGTFTISDIKSISWATNKPLEGNVPDFYVCIYTPLYTDGTPSMGSYYGERLNLEALYSDGYTSAPANAWNVWTTGVVEDQVQTLVFDFFRAPKGFSTGPTLAQIQGGLMIWSTYYYDDTNPLNNEVIDYGPLPVMAIAVSTGSEMAKTFEGYLDAIIVTLKDGSSVTFDLEAGETGNFPMLAEVQLATVSISLTPTGVDFGPIIAGYPTESVFLAITHDGTALEEKITVELMGDTNGFYESNLKFSGNDHPYDTWYTLLTPGEDMNVLLDLSVPQFCEPGDYTGTLVFWAEEIEAT